MDMNICIFKCIFRKNFNFATFYVFAFYQAIQKRSVGSFHYFLDIIRYVNSCRFNSIMENKTTCGHVVLDNCVVSFPFGTVFISLRG